MTFVGDDEGHRFLPQIFSGGLVRSFDPDDMVRVLDFENCSSGIKDGPMRICEEFEQGSIDFPRYHFCLRAGYLFYFAEEDVDEGAGPYATYDNPPVGVIPLNKVHIEFPPGGRRVFREHAQTEARNGYEFALVHVPESEEDGEERSPFFLVAESLGKREKWSSAIKERAFLDKPTLLRTGYNKTLRSSQSIEDAMDAHTSTRPEQATAPEEKKTPEKIHATAAESEPTRQRPNRGRRRGENRSVAQQAFDISEDAELASAVVEFGKSNFDENEWMESFFATHNDFDVPGKTSQMENWLQDMKKSLKGAVLEQYEYFVQASGEMTTMGREVSALKSLIESQVETIKAMKDIDFSAELEEHTKNMNYGADGGENEPPSLKFGTGNGLEDQSVASEYSSIAGTSPRKGNDALVDQQEDDAPGIDLPDWLPDVPEDVESLVRENRYNDAIDLVNKGKAEVSDLFDKHERPTLYRLNRSQLNELSKLRRRINELANEMCERIQTKLRRKNEALRQLSKRDRSDAHSSVLTVVSPCAIEDDAIYLRYLVKLGRPQEASEVYSTRRALMLQETLQERPISGSGSVDLVIYAAQLSQSFFSCLASSIEGFLDLFLTSSSSSSSQPPEDASLTDVSSMNSHSGKGAPAGAVASVVLWCDAELSKFAVAFGGTRVLANLALTPPSRDRRTSVRMVGQEEGPNGSKERQNALQVAAQCLDQAFLYAAENLDSVGLPLAPRLADCLRSRLKGCEAEIWSLLDKRWQPLTSSWKIVDVVE